MLWNMDIGYCNNYDGRPIKTTVVGGLQCIKAVEKIVLESTFSKIVSKNLSFWEYTYLKPTQAPAKTNQLLKR